MTSSSSMASRPRLCWGGCSAGSAPARAAATQNRPPRPLGARQWPAKGGLRGWGEGRPAKGGAGARRGPVGELGHGGASRVGDAAGGGSYEGNGRTQRRRWAGVAQRGSATGWGGTDRLRGAVLQVEGAALVGGGSRSAREHPLGKERHGRWAVIVVTVIVGALRVAGSAAGGGCTPLGGASQGADVTGAG